MLDRDQPTFQYREITLGPTASDFYIVTDGLEEGEEVVVNGVFKIDTAAQLAGKPSMMNPAGGKVSTGHDHGEHQPYDAKIEKLQVNAKFVNQLKKVYQTYLAMTNALVDSDGDEVNKLSQKVKDALAKVDMNLLKGAAHNDWMSQFSELNKFIKVIAGSQDIDKQREAFASFNQAFYKTIKTFGLSGDTTYFQYCPMALDDKGAYWFSETKDIRNPYFGDAMLKCGETKETLK